MDNADPSLTPPGRRYGTPLYMAPELARGLPHVDGRADVFGLGHILFEVITHRPLLSGKDTSEVVDQLLNNPFPKPSEIAPDKNISPELEKICLKALEKNRRNRYQSVEALMHDLMEFLSRA